MGILPFCLPVVVKLISVTLHVLLAIGEINIRGRNTAH